MRVCMVVFGDLPYDFRVHRGASCLREAGYEVTIVASDFGGAPLPDAWRGFQLHLIRIDRNQSLRRSYPSFWHSAARLARKADADVYHAHDLDSLWPAAHAARCRQAALVYDSHELFADQSSLLGRPLVQAFWRGLERRLIRRVDRVMAVSPAVADSLEERYRLARPPAVVRNLPPFRHPVQSDRLRATLGLRHAAPPLALYQGGFLTDNGLAEQIEAMRHVESGLLVLLGGGPTEAQLRRLVSSSGLGERVRFLERVPFPQLHEYTCGADVGLCVIKPTGRSFYWSLPNKLFEYFMAGLPVIAGDTPAIRAVLEDTGAGVLVDPLDPVAIGKALQSLLSDTARRAQLAAAARVAAGRYCWDREAPRLLEVYRSL